MNLAISTSVIQRGESGVARYVFELVRSLLDTPGSHRLTLFVLQEDIPLFDFASKRVRIIPVAERWRSPVKNIFWHQFVLPFLLRKENADVVHIPSYRRMLAFAPCPMVSTIHDLAPFRLAGKYDPVRMFYGRYIARFLAKRQDAILTVSHFTGSDLKTFFRISPAKIRVVWNGLEHERFHPGNLTPTKREQAPPPADTPFFLYLSRLEHPAKNHVRLIEAFDRFKTATGSNWRLVLAGGDWHGAEVIRNAAANARHHDAIEFPGFVSDEVLPDLYRKAGAMIFPSLFEGFGLPPIEAMACGCPVISSDRGALREVVGDSALMIDPESIDSLQESLATIAVDPELQAELRRKGLEHAQKFRWENVAQTLLDTCRNTLRPPFGGIETPAFETDSAPNRHPSHVIEHRSHPSPSLAACESGRIDS
ncbi:MAG: glycosyltransferase family 4 protein [Verrucomicrobiales bacterium]|nr:glycosyltransferase family 4 protein [Verrucomicrobiales bacterium]